MKFMSTRPSCPVCGQPSLTGELRKISKLYYDELDSYETTCENPSCLALVELDYHHNVISFNAFHNGKENNK